ncbi:MAG: hypothetical protein V7672_00380 [Brevundimonas sp.]|uniref:hypothetical protein n=1 Tax=Brevundimonas sp. TaxID=1871086 RepID=UPI003001DE49
MTEIITSAGQLLKELRRFHGTLGKGNQPLHTYIIAHFSIDDAVPWQMGVARFEKVVDRASLDLDILPEPRQVKYRETLSEIRRIVHPEKYAEQGSTALRNSVSELSIERLENFNDSLLLAGRSFSLEDARVESVVEALQSLLDEMESEPSDIDDAIAPKIKDLITALDHYALFGAEGVEDYVAMLIGAALTRGMETVGPLPDVVKSRINRILSVSKAAMDGFVYLASGAQGIEWAGAHFGLIAPPA